MSNRINLGMKALAGIAALVVLGFAISFVIPRLQNNSVATNETQTVSPVAEVTGDLIAFVSIDEKGNREIYTMKSDGGDLTNLTNHPATDESPAWSPDGTKIAFVSDRDGGRDIYLMGADGSNVRKLTDSSTFNDHFAWSPDGTKIVYLSSEETTFDPDNLMIMNADGGNTITLTPQPGKYNFLAWSPDGQYIVYQASDLGEEKYNRLLVADINGIASADGPYFEGDDGRQHQQVYWEADGQFVTISSNFEQPLWGKWNITRFFTDGDNARYNGSNPILVTSDTPILAIFENTYVTLQQDSLVWMAYQGAPIAYSPWKTDYACETKVNFDLQKTPDGVHGFVSVNCENGWTSFYLVNSDGSEIKQLGAALENMSALPFPAWSPDGKHVIVTIADIKGEHLFRFDSDNPSAKPVQLTSDGISNHGAVWQPSPIQSAIKETPTPEPISFNLTITEAETLAGFHILEPTHLPTGFVLEGASYDATSQKATLRYISQNDSGVLYIFQERGTLMQGPAIQPYTTPIVIGDFKGEYSRGAWVYESQNTTTPTWDPNADHYSLRWQQGEWIISIDFLGGETITPLLLDELIRIAESMQ